MTFEMAIAIGSLLIAMIAVYFSWQGTKFANESVKQAFMLNLFSTFDEANKATIENPDLLYSVHGLDESIPQDEAARIAYLSLLIDGFHHFYGELFNEDFSKMQSSLQNQSVFLNRILAIEENQKRWALMKPLYYGEFDKSFIDAVDKLIVHENRRKTK